MRVKNDPINLDMLFIFAKVAKNDNDMRLLFFLLFFVFLTFRGCAPD